MSLLSRRTLLLSPLALAACGFSPVYRPGGNGVKLRNRVLVDPPGSQDSYILVRELEERLGRSTNPTYALSMVITTSEARVAIDREGDTGRFNRIGIVDFSLRDLSHGSGRQLRQGRQLCGVFCNRHHGGDTRRRGRTRRFG